MCELAGACCFAGWPCYACPTPAWQMLVPAQRLGWVPALLSGTAQMLPGRAERTSCLPAVQVRVLYTDPANPAEPKNEVMTLRGALK